jgi:ferritin
MAIISDKIKELVQLRIKHESENNSIYLDMANQLDFNGFPGAAKLWYDYAKEELHHKKWAVNYLLAINELPIEPSIEIQPIEFKGLPNIIALTYQRELQTTDECKTFAIECLSDNDVMTFVLAQKYVKEQINELSKIQKWIDRLSTFGDGPIALRELDNEMLKSR